MIRAKLYNRLLILAILLLVILFMGCVWIAPAFADSNTPAAVLEETPTPVPTESAVVVEFIPSPTPDVNLTPAPTPVQDLNFIVEDFDMPRDVEALWLKVLWYCPIQTEKSNNPNYEKIGLLWVLINEFECSKVIDSTGKVMNYSELSQTDKDSYNYSHLFPRDWEKLLMRAGDHDWFRTSVEKNQPWHESETNSIIVNLVYDVWKSEQKCLNSGRTVPREYIYYAFVKDNSGANRKLEIYRTKEDLQNAERAYNWTLKGTLDK